MSAGAALAATPAVAEVVSNGADQTVELQAAIDHAAGNGGLLRLGAGKFLVSGLSLKASLQIEGVAGHTRLVALGNVDILSVEGAERLNISGVTFEGGGNGLVLKNCGGRISGNEFLLQEKTALFALDSTGLEISGNHVHDIGNNGIQVWTSEKREDGTLVINNRVEHIAAKAGGSGQNGNGINIYKAAQVLVANNRISDCYFSAIRNNAGSNCQILGNNISRTGEVAIYVEFAFEGAVVSNNMLDDVGFGISITNFNEGGRLAVCSNNLVRNANGGNTGRREHRRRHLRGGRYAGEQQCGGERPGRRDCAGLGTLCAQSFSAGKSCAELRQRHHGIGDRGCCSKLSCKQCDQRLQNRRHPRHGPSRDGDRGLRQGWRESSGR